MTIPTGAFVVLLGPTGAGKTTTLRLIAGLDRPDSGDVRIAGQSVVLDTPAQRWGVATDHDRVLLCGAGARRGGGVSGIAGQNAAMAALERLAQ